MKVLLTNIINKLNLNFIYLFISSDDHQKDIRSTCLCFYLIKNLKLKKESSFQLIFFSSFFHFISDLILT